MPKQAALEHEKARLRDEIADGDVIDADYEIDDTIDEVSAKVGEGGAQYVVRVWRINPGEAEREALCAITPGEFSMEYVRQHYGPGTYDIWLYRGRAVNRRWTGRKIGVPLDWEPPKKPSEIAADARQDETHLILQGIKELGTLIFKAQESARVANPPPLPPPVLDPIAMQNSMLESMQRMRALFAPPQAPTNDGSRLAFDAFVEGVKIMKDVGGGNGAEKGIWDVLQTMAEPNGLLGRLTDMAQAADNRLTTPPQLVGPDGKPIPYVAVAPGAPAAPEAAPAPDLQQMQFILKMRLADLVASAKNGADPGLYAELVIDKVGAQRAQEFVNGPEAIDKLIAINPEVANHVEWFRAVGIHINDMLTEAATGGDGGTDEPTTQGDDVAPIETTDGDAARDT